MKIRRTVFLATCLAAASGVTATAAGTRNQSALSLTATRELYCMPHPVARADGTTGIAVDLLRGQPTEDPTYTGATPANEIRVLTYTDGKLSSSLSYLTCDPPVWETLPVPFFGYDGDYPVYQLVSVCCAQPVVVPPI